MRALRLTVVSGRGSERRRADATSARRCCASRARRGSIAATTTLAGVGGVRADGGFVVTSAIGTNDSSATLVYQPPPGVDRPGGRQGRAVRVGAHSDQRAVDADSGGQHVRSIIAPKRISAFRRDRRILSGLSAVARVGPRPRQRLGSERRSSDVREGRSRREQLLSVSRSDERGPDAGGVDRPRDRLQPVRQSAEARFRRRISPASRNRSPAPAPTRRSSPRRRFRSASSSHRFAACDDGYMVYTVDPAVTAPNLAAVQELAVGIIRLGASGGASAILPADTLELWVDDIRLGAPGQRDAASRARSSFGMNAADFGDVRINISNRDPQLPSARRAADVPLGAERRRRRRRSVSTAVAARSRASRCR